MKLYFFLAVIFLTFSQTLGFTVDSIPPEGLKQAQYLSRTLPTDSISENCGGILSNATGGIVYNVLGPIQRNERCVWVLRGGRANSFSIDVLYKRNESDTQLSATCFYHRAVTTNVKINSTGLVTSITACNVVVITFSTGNNVSASATGLVLQYTATQGGSLSAASTDQIITPNDAPHLRYPLMSNYSNVELSTFTYFSANQNSTGASAREISVTYIRNGLEAGCFDYLSVYYFNYTTLWQKDETICEDVETTVLTSQGPILITFESDGSQFGTGFHLIHSVIGGSECGL
ncbi:unnamed protein product [Orchesella dallaii]|uniref:Cubilin n=1 Tax=Orchesella dallaii TaxID=48710 RepID=A0ABP1S0E1_9HEXA